MSSAFQDESKRVSKFRADLIQQIPRFPNTRESLNHMKVRPLAALILDYLNWRSRFVGSRPRVVKIDLLSQGDRRWIEKSDEIKIFFDLVQSGYDISSNLSQLPFTRGYSIAAHSAGATQEQAWLDKDFLLNTKGYHHFHFGSGTDHNGHNCPSNLLILAKISRDEFFVLGIFDHDVFKVGTNEWLKLENIHNQLLYRDLPASSMVAMGNIASSGHSDIVVMHGLRCLRVIQALDPHLDQHDFVKNLYEQIDIAPSKSKPRWCFHHLDLAIYDQAKPAILVVERGWT